MSRETLQTLIDNSPVAHHHQLRARDDGSVSCVVRREETGSNEMMHRSVMTLMLEAAGHGLVEDSTPCPRLTIDQHLTVEPGKTLVATAKVINDEKRKGGIVTIEATIHEENSGAKVASAVYCRRRTK